MDLWCAVVQSLMKMGESMKAVVYYKYGAPEVLQIADVQKPLPKDNELLIKVRAAEVTKADCEMRSFDFPVKWFWLPLRLAIGVFKPRRHILGAYFAGEVESIGKDVTEYKVGDRIFGSTGIGFGAHGEYISLREDQTMALIPDNVSYEQAAATPLGALNALHFMRLAKIKAHESVLINGAGGSIGLFALQIARDMGAEVSVVDSGIKEKMLRAAGAVDFVDYAKTNFADQDKTYDVVFDMVAGSVYGDCIKVLNPKGRLLIGNPRISKMLRSVMTTRFTDKTAKFAFAKETNAELLAVSTMLEEGRITAIVDKVMPMDDAAEAHRLVETEQRLGAIVLAIAP